MKPPPVAVFLICAAGMWLVAKALPVAEVVFVYAKPAAAVVLVFGLGIAAAGVVGFIREGTTVDPRRPEATTTLVRDGIYRFTRNPMYLGLAICLLAWGIFLLNAVALLWIVAFVAYLNRFQIGPEERVLLQKFGSEYTDYVAEVRRWL